MKISTDKDAMKTRRSLSSLSRPNVGRLKRHDRPCGIAGGNATAPPVIRMAILLVSRDTALGGILRRGAYDGGRLVVQVGGLLDALHAVRSAQFAVVLLDLDLPSQGAWQIADSLLQEAHCPPLILLTARRDQFDVSTAIRAGALVDKAADCASLLQAVDQAVALPDSNRGERNAIQRIMIQWLRPCAWSVPVTPSYRFWGLNE